MLTFGAGYTWFSKLRGENSCSVGRGRAVAERAITRGRGLLTLKANFNAWTEDQQFNVSFVW